MATGSTDQKAPRASSSLEVTLGDILALVNHQAQTVGATAQGLLTGDSRASPELLVATSLRLYELVQSFTDRLQEVRAQQPAPGEASAQGNGLSPSN